MALLVQKYGGTSVGTPERIQAVADRIKNTVAQGHQLVVVVSAMGDTTDDLIELALKVSKSPPHREMDMLLTAGERISMALLSMALSDREVGALSFTGSQSGIITDSSHRRARIKRILGDRIRAALSQSKVAIVAGFQGVSESKEITTLGRGGSDTTAVALAAALKAEACEIYTDVDGVYSADPRHVAKAKLWKTLPADLMVELAVRGAGVLHPRCVELAQKYSVSLYVKNSFNQTEGTHVASTANMEDFRIAGVTTDLNKALLTIDLMRPTVLNAVCERAAASSLPIISPVFTDRRIQFFTDLDSEGDWSKLLGELAQDGFIEKYQFDRYQVPLSVVGSRFSQDGAALSQIIETLAQNSISVTMGAASALAVTVAVKKTHAQDGVAALHQKFFENEESTR